MTWTGRGRGLAILMVGLGAGAAVFATAAAASPEPDPLWGTTWPTGSGWSIPDPAAEIAAPASEVNLSVSLFGVPLVQEGTAHAQSAGLTLAIANGADAHAVASGLLTPAGLFNVAVADGTGSQAYATGPFTAAFAHGSGSLAEISGSGTAIAAGDGSGAAAVGFGETAVAVGDNAQAAAPSTFGGLGALLTGGSHAYAFGDDTTASTGGSFSLAEAFGDGSTASTVIQGPGSFATAAVFGADSTANAGWFGSLAAVFGDNTTASANTPLAVDIEPLFAALGVAPGDTGADSWLAGLFDGAWLTNLINLVLTG